MLYIRPTREGFEAYNVYHRKLFAEENCSLLFRFIESDTASIRTLLASHFEKRIDAESLCPKEGSVPKTLCSRIKKEMDQIHPCLAADRHITLFSMLAEQMNKCILECGTVPAKEQYADLLNHLFSPLLEIGSEPLPPSVVPTSKEFIEKHYRQLADPQNLQGIDYIENVRSEAERYIFWILDQSSVRFRDLDRSTRVRLYSQVFSHRGIRPDLRFMSYFYWREPEEYHYYDHTVEARVLRDLEEGISVAESGDRNARKWQAQHHRDTMAGYLAQLHDDSQEMTDELKAFIDDEIHSAQEDAAATMFEEYRADNFYQLVQLQLWLLTKGDTIIKRCRHCGRLFIADRLTVEYCNRVADGETEPCDIAGPKKSFTRLMDGDSALKSYNRVYKTKYARVKRGTMTEADFNEWKAEARRMLDQCRAGEISEDDYEAWLQSDIRAWGTMIPAKKKIEKKKLGE